MVAMVGSAVVTSCMAPCAVVSWRRRIVMSGTMMSPSSNTSAVVVGLGPSVPETPIFPRVTPHGMTHRKQKPICYKYEDMG